MIRTRNKRSWIVNASGMVAGLLMASAALSWQQTAAAQSDAPTITAQPNTANGKKAPEPELEFPRPSETTYPAKAYTQAEIKQVCAKYDGQTIAYYSDFWKVVNCVRRPIIDAKTIYEHLRGGKQVIDVTEDVIATLPEGEPLDWAISKEAARGCKQLEGQYVTYSAVDVYFVERCKKRLFTDWATYLKHREKRGDSKGEILSLSWLEFEELPSGEPVPSIIDDIFAKLLKGDIQVDVIPIDEACEGVDGKIASYYSRLYRIEQCHKREIMAPDAFIKSFGMGPVQVVELRSEQWLSLPDGKPIAAAPAAAMPAGARKR